MLLSKDLASTCRYGMEQSRHSQPSQGPLIDVDDGDDGADGEPFDAFEGVVLSSTSFLRSTSVSSFLMISSLSIVGVGGAGGGGLSGAGGGESGWGGASTTTFSIPLNSLTARQSHGSCQLISQALHAFILHKILACA